LSVFIAQSTATELEDPNRTVSKEAADNRNQEAAVSSSTSPVPSTDVSEVSKMKKKGQFSAQLPMLIQLKF